VGWAREAEGVTRLKISTTDQRQPIHYTVEEALKDLAESFMMRKEKSIYWTTLRSRNIYVIDLNSGKVEVISKLPGMPVSFFPDLYYYFSDADNIVSKKYSHSALMYYSLPEVRGELLPFVGPIVFFRKMEGKEDLYFSVEGYVLRSQGRLPLLIKGGLLAGISISIEKDKFVLKVPKAFGCEEGSFEIDYKTLKHEKLILCRDPEREKCSFDLEEGVEDLKKA
jgi:hypothetical protein